VTPVSFFLFPHNILDAPCGIFFFSDFNPQVFLSQFSPPHFYASFLVVQEGFFRRGQSPFFPRPLQYLSRNQPMFAPLVSLPAQLLVFFEEDSDSETPLTASSPPSVSDVAPPYPQRAPRSPLAGGPSPDDGFSVSLQ